MAGKPKSTPAQRRKIDQVIREWKRGDLRSSSGRKVTDRDMALAIAYRMAGVPKRTG